MKKQFLFFAMIAGLFMACQSNTQGDAAKTGDAKETTKPTAAATKYAVDPAASVIEWEGYKPGKYGHKGTIKLIGGQITAKDGKPESGNFVLDMVSLANTDLEDPAKKAKLEGHLKSGDFFEVEKFPTAKFEMTGIAPPKEGVKGNHIITGNLTMKDITKSIEIPVSFKTGEGMIMFRTPEFTINRTEWGVNFNSGILGTVKDNLIADDVKLKIQLVAKEI
ncbi:MAG TPA: YceI family protein [Bacteroidetes bacterium]|nr:YceI family protein [Bacteroidota bacterium]